MRICYRDVQRVECPKQTDPYLMSALQSRRRTYLGGDGIHAEGIGIAMKASGIGETNCFADQARKDPSRCFLPFRIQGEICSSDLGLARGVDSRYRART